MENVNADNQIENEQSRQFPPNIQPIQQPLPIQPTQNQPNVVMPVNSDTATNITSLASLQSYASGIAVRLPDFGEGQPLVARLRRPSLLVLAKTGKIPNSLLTAASELFSHGTIKNANENTLNDMYEICKVVCEASLVQPTMQEIVAAGMELTDEQLLAIFNYSQVGVKALTNFREE